MNPKNIFLKETIKDENKIQNIYSFPNGYGASVIKGPYTYGGKDGKWELAVINNITEEGFDMCYDTEITDDVIGHLNDPEVDRLLYKIRDL